MLFLFSLLIFIAILLVIIYTFVALNLLNVALFLAYGFLGFIIFLYTLLLVEAYRVIFLGRAPYVRSSKKILKKLMQEIDFQEGAIVFDLGCGDGLFLRELQRHNKKIKAIGYEYALIPYVLGRIYSFISRSKVKIILADFIKADISQADYVFCFLMGEEMVRLEKKVYQELKPGAMVISNTFQFKDWRPIKIIILNPQKQAGLSNKLYLYKKV